MSPVASCLFLSISTINRLRPPTWVFITLSLDYYNHLWNNLLPPIYTTHQYQINFLQILEYITSPIISREDTSLKNKTLSLGKLKRFSPSKTILNPCQSILHKVFSENVKLKMQNWWTMLFPHLKSSRLTFALTMSQFLMLRRFFTFWILPTSPTLFPHASLSFYVIVKLNFWNKSSYSL